LKKKAIGLDFNSTQDKHTLHPEDVSNATQKEQVTGTAKIHSTTIISSILKNKNKKD
jgi:hypothetical protein